MSTHRRTATAICLGLALLLSFACGDPQAGTVHPAISVEKTGGGKLERLSFGEVPLARELERTYEIHAIDRVPLGILGFGIEAEDAPTAAAFSAHPAAPWTIAGLSSGEARVRFRPTEARRYLATLVIRSDDPKRREVRIPLDGDGVAGRLEVLACLPNTAALPRRCADTKVTPPAPLSLGDVTAGAHGAALITLRNGGGDALQIARVSFDDPEAAAAAGFTLPPNAGAGMTIPSLEAGDFTVDFNPPPGTEGPASTRIRIDSDSITDPVVEVDLLAEVKPNAPPFACLFLRELRHADGTVEEFAPGDPVPPVEPSDTLIFDAGARPGCSGDPEDGADVRIDWSLMAPGPGARLVPVAGEPMARKLEAEATGIYRIGVVVQDSLGLQASTDAAGLPASVEIDVVPRRDIAVEISWAGDPLVDIDLHFVRGTASLRSPGDVFWDNKAPNWGSPAESFDDPAFLFDDQGTGALVETVTLNHPEPGQTYWVHAHFHRDDRNRTGAADCTTDASCDGLVCSLGKCMEPIDVSLKVFLYGVEEELQPAFINPAQLKGPCDTWLAGKVLWPAAGGSPEFQAAGTHYRDGTPDGAVCRE